MLCYVRLWSLVSVHIIAERTRLKDGEYPLVARVLCGPCEKISKILITEADVGEEVTYDVSLGLQPPLVMFPRHGLQGDPVLFLGFSSTMTHNDTMDSWVEFNKLSRDILFQF